MTFGVAFQCVGWNAFGWNSLDATLLHGSRCAFQVCHHTHHGTSTLNTRHKYTLCTTRLFRVNSSILSPWMAMAAGSLVLSRCDQSSPHYIIVFSFCIFFLYFLFELATEGKYFLHAVRLNLLYISRNIAVTTN